MDALIGKVFDLITKGGISAIVVILALICAALGWYCFFLIKQNDKKDDKIYKIIDDYQKNNITLTDALNGIKTVLIEIKARF